MKTRTNSHVGEWRFATVLGEGSYRVDRIWTDGVLLFLESRRHLPVAVPLSQVRYAVPMDEPEQTVLADITVDRGVTVEPPPLLFNDAFSGELSTASAPEPPPAPEGDVAEGEPMQQAGE